jgi:hypothetical protein
LGRQIRCISNKPKARQTSAALEGNVKMPSFVADKFRTKYEYQERINDQAAQQKNNNKQMAVVAVTFE